MSQINKTFNELRNVRTFDADKVTSIIDTHAIAAAAAGLAGGFLPGVASVIAMLTSTGAIWSMYYTASAANWTSRCPRICSRRWARRC